MQLQSDDDDICAGFFYAKSNARTIDFFSEIVQYLNPLIDDQMAMRRFLQVRKTHFLAKNATDANYLKDPTYALRLSNKETDCLLIPREEDLLWYKTRFPQVDAIAPSSPEQLEAAHRDGVVTYFVLDRVCFANGTAYFNAKLPQRLGVDPIIVHNNCTIGHDPKKRRFQDYGLWLLKENDITPAVQEIVESPLQVLKVCSPRIHTH